MVWFVFRVPDGETLSQGVLVGVPLLKDDSVKAVGFAADTVSVCDAGALPPATPENVSEDGLRVGVELGGVVESSSVPMLLVASSANHTLPSGPAASPPGPKRPMVGKFVTPPPLRDILPSPNPPLNQMLPSGPTAISLA